jgi:class 3 adenylate cyclase
MISSRSTSTADLLLDLLECMSLGATSADQAAAELKGAHPNAGLLRRIETGIEVLTAEGLLASRPERGLMLHHATARGVAALEQRGRFAADATVLFTDIVGSTELIGTYGEAGAHERRQRHFALLRGAIEQTGGREVKSLGDGLMVVFADPVAAARCATEMQRSVAADVHQLGLRVGIHTGELLREDDDFYGSTVIIARRLCDSADRGQIIVSDATRALTARGDGSTHESLGRLALKGLAQPVAAFTLWWSQRPLVASARVVAA